MRIPGEIPLCAGLLLFAACNTPSPGFYGVSPTRIVVEQSTFDVRVLGNRAEAVRINAEYLPTLTEVAARARVAIERVSGCAVDLLDGDPAQFFALLDCGDTSEDVSDAFYSDLGKMLALKRLGPG